MVNIVHRIGIQSSIDQVYSAIATIKGLANWWTQEVEGESSIDGKITFRFRSNGGELLGEMIMQVTHLQSPQVIKWQCLEGPPEWIGTEITFELSEQDSQTILIFGHKNWREEVEFTAHCSMKWATFLLSLREYVETGTGKPSPYDFKIDNWN